MHLRSFNAIWAELRRISAAAAGIAAVTAVAGAEASADSQSAPVPNGPRIQFAEVLHDVGRVRGGEIRRLDFEFTNTGNAVLEITDVQRTCGCTATGDWTRQVPAGATGHIPIEFHTANYTGSITKSVTVLCNASNQSNVVLQVKADIWRPVELEPQSVILKACSDSVSNAVATVKIRNRMEGPLVITNLVSTHKSIAGTLKETVSGKEYELTVSVVPPLGLGNAFGRIILKTTLAEAPEVEVPAYVLLQPPLEVTPSMVGLPFGPTTNRIVRTVQIRSNSSTPLALSEPSFSLPGVVVELKEAQAGKFYGLVLTFPEGFDIPKGQSAEARVKSNYPDSSVIRIPVVKQSPPILRPTLGTVPKATNSVVR